MKRFNSLAHQPTLTIVDLPRRNWRYIPPSKWQVTLTLAGIILVSIAFAVVG